MVFLVMDVFLSGFWCLSFVLNRLLNRISDQKEVRMPEEWELDEVDENDILVELVNVNLGGHENLIALRDEESRKIVFLKDILSPEEIKALEMEAGFFAEFFISEQNLTEFGMNVEEIASGNGGIVQVTPLISHDREIPKA